MSLTIAIRPSWTLFAWGDDDGVEVLRIGPLVIERCYADREEYEIEYDETETADPAPRDASRGTHHHPADPARFAMYRDILLQQGLDTKRADVGAMMASNGGTCGQLFVTTQLRSFVTHLKRLKDPQLDAFLAVARTGGPLT